MDALRSHLAALEERLARTRRLLETIAHRKGRKAITGEQIFAGFTVGPGDDRFGEGVGLGGEPNDCKVAAADVGGAMCVFELRGGWPHPSHQEQDEWLYVVDGEPTCQVGDRRLRLQRGESLLVPRTLAHWWASTGDAPSTVLEVYQPAGRMEQFFREVGRYTDPPVREALSLEEMLSLFDAHGMHLRGPGLAGTKD